MKNSVRTAVTAERVTSILVALSAVMMEAFWVYPWLVWLGRWPALGWGRPPLHMATVLALAAISFALTRFLRERDWSSRALKWTVVGVGLLTVFVAIRTEYSGGFALLDPGWFLDIGRQLGSSFSNTVALMAALPAAGYVWWRGMLLGRATGTSHIYPNLLFGAGSFIFLGLIWWSSIGIPSFGEMASIIGVNVAGFFFFGLLAMALGNLRVVQKRMFPEEAAGLSYRRWLPVALVAAAVLLIAGLIFALVASTDFAALVKRGLEALGGFYDSIRPWLDKVLQYILLPFQYIALGVMWLITFLVNLFRGQGVSEAAREAGQAADTQIELLKTGQAPDALIATLKWLFFIVAAVAVTMLIIHTLRGAEKRRRPASPPPDFEEKRESVWSWQDFMAGVSRFFVRLWDRIRRKKQAGVASPLFSHAAPRPEEPVSTLHIREVFRRLLHDGHRAGITWRHSETPYEYAGRLSAEVPEAAVPVAELTALYVQVRYSDYDAGDAQVSRANRIWRQVRDQLKAQIAKRKATDEKSKLE